MNAIDQRRLKFIEHLHILSEPQRRHMLEIEGDAELAALKTIACDQQWFEVAASVAAIIKHREDRTGLRYVGDRQLRPVNLADNQARPRA